MAALLVFTGYFGDFGRKIAVLWERFIWRLRFQKSG